MKFIYYFFCFINSGNQYWRFDELTNKMDDEYPRGMERWNGIPGNLDTVVTSTDGKI